MTAPIDDVKWLHEQHLCRADEPIYFLDSKTLEPAARTYARPDELISTGDVHTWYAAAVYWRWRAETAESKLTERKQ
jgi:hypothetical protein